MRVGGLHQGVEQWMFSETSLLEYIYIHTCAHSLQAEGNIVIEEGAHIR